MPMAYQSDRYGNLSHQNSIDAKIVIMGNTGVGKTSLLQRYTRNTFDPHSTMSTTGALFVSKKLCVDGLKVRLQLWDTAGQERFRSMAPMYYRSAHAALLLYDITSLSSFEDIKGWLEELKKNSTDELIIYIVGSKLDLSSCRQVTEDRARLCLHTWFPPPRPPSPPRPDPVESSTTFSYIRPRFTSLTSSHSVPFVSSFTKVPETTIDGGAPAVLKRTNTSATAERNPPVTRHRHNTFTSSAAQPRVAPASAISETGEERGSRIAGSPFPPPLESYHRTDNALTPSSEDDDDDPEEDVSWGLDRGMHLVEVSSKDNRGVQQLFDALVRSIIARRSVVDRNRELRHRDSIFLKDVGEPTWGPVADEEAARQKDAARCCS